MRWFLLLLSCLLVLNLAGCALTTTAPDEPRLTPGAALEGQETRSTMPASMQQGTLAHTRECPTMPPKDMHYSSPDGKLWTSSIEFGEPGRVKILWRKPVGTELEITGRRLDGDAPSLGVQFSGGGPALAFQPSALVFPTPGCWEVLARADESTLRIVLEIKSSSIRPLPTPLP